MESFRSGNAFDDRRAEVAWKFADTDSGFCDLKATTPARWFQWGREREEKA
jgi:hypothetical protein